MCRRRLVLRASGAPSLPGRLERESLFERRGKRLGKKKNPSTSQPLKLRPRIEREPTQARGVSVCRLRRSMAGRAARVGEAERHHPALLWDGCHCSVPSERGCEGDELGSLRTPPSTSAINAPLPLPRSRCFAQCFFDDGGGLRRLAAALRLTPQAQESSSFLSDDTSPNPFPVVGSDDGWKEKMSRRSGSDFGTLGNKHVLDDGDYSLLLIAGKVADFLENAAQLPGRAGTVARSFLDAEQMIDGNTE